MGKKYFETKKGSLEEAALGIWQDAAEEVGKLIVKQEGFSSSLVKKAVKIAADMSGDMTAAVKTIEKLKKGLSDDPAVADALRSANEQKEESSKVDGRTKGYKEALRRIKVRQERKRAISKPVAEETLEEIEEEDKKSVDEGWGAVAKAADELMQKSKDRDEKEKYKKLASWIKKQKEEYDPELEEASGDKEAYKKFFDAALKKFDAKSPADMDDEKKKKFFDYIDKNWEGADEKKESIQKWMTEGELPPALKKAIAAKKKKAGKDDDEEDEDEDEKKESIEEVGVGESMSPLMAAVVADISNRKKKINKDEDEDENPVGKDYNEDVELDEAGRPKGAARIENERFWDLKDKELHYIIKDAGEAVQANPTSKKATQGPGNWSDQINDAATVLYWRKKKNIKVESVNEAAIDDLKKIVKTKSIGKVSGVKVDLFSASAMVKVYDALNSKNQAKVDKMLKDKRGIATFQDFAFSQVKK